MSPNPIELRRLVNQAEIDGILCPNFICYGIANLQCSYIPRKSLLHIAPYIPCHLWKYTKTHILLTGKN